MQSSNHILCREQSKLNPSCREIRSPRVCVCEFARKKEQRRPPSILTKKTNQSECKAMWCTITGGQKPSKLYFFLTDSLKKKTSFCLRLDSGHDVISAHKEGKENLKGQPCLRLRECISKQTPTCSEKTLAQVNQEIAAFSFSRIHSAALLYMQRVGWTRPGSH